MHLNVQTEPVVLNQTRTSSLQLFSPVDSCQPSSASESHHALYSTCQTNTVYWIHIVLTPIQTSRCIWKVCSGTTLTWALRMQSRWTMNECPAHSFCVSWVWITISGAASFQPSWSKTPDGSGTPLLSSCFNSDDASKLAKLSTLKSTAWITSQTRCVTSAFDFCLLPVSLHDISCQTDIFAQGHGGAQMPEGP